VLNAYEEGAGGRAAGLKAFLDASNPSAKRGKKRELLSDEDVLEALRETHRAEGMAGMSRALEERLHTMARAAKPEGKGNTIAVSRLIGRVSDPDDKKEAARLWGKIKKRKR